jgi:hypothetical protein
MSDTNPNIAKLRSVFLKVARGELCPTNFGRCLLNASKEGLSTKQEIADMLGVESRHILQAGNGLRPRGVADISRAIVERYDRQWV